VPPAPVAGAWVELLAPSAARIALTRTDTAGHFQFVRLREGPHGLRASASSLGVTPIRSIMIPEPSGEYDLSF
jgi:hypothetical protein